MSVVVNLGQVSAIYINGTPPNNIKVLWYDTTITTGSSLKYYDQTTSTWKLLVSNTGEINDNIISPSTTWSSQKIKNEITLGSTFTQDIPVVLSNNKTLGKYVNGQTIPTQGKTIQEVITDIAQEMLSPTLAMSVPTSVREVGGSNAVVINWTVTKGTNPITQITINGQSITPTGNNQTGTVNATATTTFGVKTFNGSVSDGFSTSNQTASVNYTWKSFYGSAVIKPIDSATVRALPLSRFDTESNVYTYQTGTVNKVFCIVLPSTKQLTSVIDLTNLNLNITSSFTSESITVKDAGGTDRIYTLWTMQTGVPYNNNSIHQVTVSNV